jgi:hypothetical protein
VRRDVAATIRRLAPSLPDVRFVRDEGVHVTLRFLGWTRAETLAALEAPLACRGRRLPAIEMAMRGLASSLSAAVPACSGSGSIFRRRRPGFRPPARRRPSRPGWRRDTRASIPT